MRGLAAELITGLSILTSGAVLSFVPCLVIWSFFTGGGKRGCIFSVHLLAGIALVIAPVTARNALVGRELVFITAHGGVNFYMGNNPGADGTFSPPGASHAGAGDLIERSKMTAEREVGRRLSASEVSSYWFGRGFDFIRSHPGRYAALLINKFRLYWSASEISDIVDFDFSKRYTPLLALPLPVFGIVAPLAIAGMVIGLGAWRKLLLLYLYVFSQMLSCLIFFVNSRYRLPVVPALVVFASLALFWEIDRLRQRDRRGALLFFIPLLLGVGLTSSKRVVLDRSVSHYNAGNAYRARGQMDTALGEYRAALRLDPRIPGARVNIGLIYEGMGLESEAERAYLEELGIAPDSLGAHNNLANVYNRRGKLPEAEAHYLRAIGLGPPNATIHNNLGTVYAKRGMFEKAVEEWGKAIEIDPGNESVRESIRTMERSRGRRRGRGPGDDRSVRGAGKKAPPVP